MSIGGQASAISAQTARGAGDQRHQGGVLSELPDITLMSVDGLEISLKELEGKAVLVNFWATWCPPCREEMSSLQEFHQQYLAEGVVVVAINAGESAAQVDQFAKECVFDL